MSQQSRNSNQWPKAAVAIFGLLGISAAAYFLKEPQIMWSLILLAWLVDIID